MRSWVEIALVFTLRSLLAEYTSGKKAFTLKLVDNDTHSLFHMFHTYFEISFRIAFGETGAYRVVNGEGDLAQKLARTRPGEFGLAAVKT